MFRSETGSGFEDPGGTPPPRIPRSTPPPPGSYSAIIDFSHGTITLLLRDKVMLILLITRSLEIVETGLSHLSSFLSSLVCKEFFLERSFRCFVVCQ